MGKILVGTRLIASPLADHGCLHAEGDAINRVPTRIFPILSSTFMIASTCLNDYHRQDAIMNVDEIVRETSSCHPERSEGSPRPDDGCAEAADPSLRSG